MINVLSQSRNVDITVVEEYPGISTPQLAGVSQMPEEKFKTPSQITEELCLHTPLYNNKNLSDYQPLNFTRFLSDKNRFDTYCDVCEQTGTFRGINQPAPSCSTDSAFNDRKFSLAFQCTRCIRQQLEFHFIIFNKMIVKFGQFPSMVDLSLPSLQKYRKVLSDENYEEFARAVGLVTHGVGIGSFVYLRRIFERLVEEAHKVAKLDSEWNEKAYETRMADKIKLLATYLPTFLVENKALYSILSKGIHELSEQECLAAFNTVKLGIELILDEKLEAKAKAVKITNAQKSIAGLNQTHKTPTTGASE